MYCRVVQFLICTGVIFLYIYMLKGRGKAMRKLAVNDDEVERR